MLGLTSKLVVALAVADARRGQVLHTAVLNLVPCLQLKSNLRNLKDTPAPFMHRAPCCVAAEKRRLRMLTRILHQLPCRSHGVFSTITWMERLTSPSG